MIYRNALLACMMPKQMCQTQKGNFTLANSQAGLTNVTELLPKKILTIT